MKNQKGNILLIILGVVMVAIVAGGIGYFIVKKPAQKEEQKQEEQINQQQIQQEQQKTISEITEQKAEQLEIKDETASWKTYRNEKYGFELKYPDNLNIFEPSRDSMVYIGKEVFTGPSASYGVRVSVSENPKNLIAKDWYIQYYNILKEEAVKNNWPFLLKNPGEGQNISINSYDVFEIEQWGGDKGIRENFISKEGRVFKIYFDIYPKENDIDAEDHLKTNNQILSTFKFTK